MKRILLLILLAAGHVLFLWMFFASSGFEATAGTEAARRFASDWRHGMTGESLLYMPGFFAVSLSTWLWSREGRWPRLLAEGSVVLLVAAGIANILGPAGASRLLEAFCLETGFRCEAALRGPTALAAARGLLTLVTWSVVVVAGQKALALKSWKPWAAPVLLAVALATARPVSTLGGLWRLWLERVLQGETTAIVSLVLIPVALAFLIGSEIRHRRRVLAYGPKGGLVLDSSDPMIFRPAILYVDDEEANLKAFKRAFGEDYLVRTCLSADEALKVLETEDFPLVIADQRMPGMTGIELCERLVALKPQTTRMILTAYTETQMLLDAINRGQVHDYLVKPWRKAELKPVLDKAFEDHKARAAKLQALESRAGTAERLTEEIGGIYDFEGLIGSSSGLKPVVDVIRKAAQTDSTILILGETGTGKELLARAVHAASRRKDGPFVPVHCAALTQTLLESELFGHERGAFTGADQARPGRFEQAAGGTVFLDEIGEVPMDVQVKLLRVLQEKEIQRVGGNRTIPVDVRLVAATNRDLKSEVKAGRFREDLYFRLNVIPVTVPPLRDRPQDIPHLAQFFLMRFNRQLGRNLVFQADAIHHLGRYDWPGNVREIQNIVERAAILGPGPEIGPEDLNLPLHDLERISSIPPEKIPATGTLRDQILTAEAGQLGDALRQAGGNIAEAARLLGVARSTLFHRLRKHKLI